MGKVIISTNTDKKKVQEVALGIEEIYRAGIRYRISEFILAFGGGINRTPGKGDDFIIPGPHIEIKVWNRVDSYFSCPRIQTTIVGIYYKEYDIEIDDTQAAWNKTSIKELKEKNEEQKSLIEDLEERNKRLKKEIYRLMDKCEALNKEKNMKENEEPEKKIEELRCLIDDLVKHNKELKDENYRLLQERGQLKEKIMKLGEEAAKEKENKEIEEWRHLIDVLQKNLELKDKDIKELMDQIEQLKNVIFNLNLKIYGKKEDKENE